MLPRAKAHPKKPIMTVPKASTMSPSAVRVVAETATNEMNDASATSVSARSNALTETLWGAVACSESTSGDEADWGGHRRCVEPTRSPGHEARTAEALSDE